MSRKRLSPWLLALAVLCLAPAVLLAQDVIYKTDGGKLRGKIVQETRRGVKIETLGGTYFVPRDEIQKVVHDGDVFREFARRQGSLSATDADGWYRLGAWAQDQELYPQAVDCFNQVLRIEPDHEDARWELGYRRLNGRWVTESEYYQARGYVRWQDRWVTPEERDKLAAGMVRVGGRWLTPKEAAEAEARRSKGTGGSARPGASQPGDRGGDGGDGDGGDGGDGGGTAGGTRARKHPSRPGARRGRRGGAFPWAGGGGGGGPAPIGGQVGGKPLTPAQRQAALQQQKQAGGWKVAYASKYYDFLSNGPEAEVRRLAFTMDLMCDEYKRIFKFDQELTRPFPVHLYANQQAFMAATGHGPGVGGFYDGKEIVAFHGHLGNLTTQSVLFHEGTHQFEGLVLGQNMWKAKIWLIEGLAVFFEASQVQGRHLLTGAIPKERLANVKRAIQTNSYVHLRDLIRLDQAQFGALHYAHAWSLIYFLVNGTQGGKKRFIQYWEAMKEGGHDPVALFEELFNRPMDQIEAAWKQYVLRLG